jgi:hypothetical protein
MNFIGATTWWLVPSCHAVLSLSTTSTALLTLSRAFEVAGRVKSPGG